MIQEWCFIIILSGIVLSGCVGRKVNRPESVEESPDFPLTPYQSLTPSPVRQAIETSSIITATIAPTPTATPITYRVIQGDTMLAIALRYGVRLEELLAANPDVDPSLMSIGTELIIPSSETNVTIFTTPTPMALKVHPAECYQDARGEVWCFILVKNDQPRSIENVAARVSLIDEGGSVIATDEATAPLNIIRVGQALPLTVNFSTLADQEFSVVVELVSALPVPRNDGRYLNVVVEIETVEYHSQGGYAIIKGMVQLPERGDTASLVWLAAVGYGADDRVVAVRKSELDGPLAPGIPEPFEIELFSLGPKIERVDVLGEARP
jgi:LysM repeat protein